MLILFPPLLLFAAAAAVALLRFLRPKFRFGWLISVAAAGLAGVSVLLWQPQIQSSTLVSFSHPAGFAVMTLAFSAPTLLWPYAVGVAALGLAVLLTAPGRARFPDPHGFALTLSLTGLGLLAVTAASAVTLALAWAALDLAELVITLWWSQEAQDREQAVVTFSLRAGGIALLLLAQVLGSAAGQVTDFASMQPGVGLILAAAAALRLGMLPARIPSGSETTARHGVWTSIRLTSAAASLALLSRIPSAGFSGPDIPVLIVLCALAAVYSGWRWLSSPDEFMGSPSWFGGIASLSVACALRGNAAGSTAWGMALILAGGALFISSFHQVWLSRLQVVGAWSISSLPLSLTAVGWNNASGTVDWELPILLMAEALLLAGFLRYTLRQSSRAALETQPAWAATAYPGGIVLLLLLQLLLALWGWAGAFQVGPWLAGGVASVLGLAFFYAMPRLAGLKPAAAWLPRHSSPPMTGFHPDLKAVFSGLMRVSEMITDVLQGEAGIIWSLVLLILFVALIAGKGR